MITLLATLLNQYIAPLPPVEPSELPRFMPTQVKAIYVTSQTAKLADRMRELKQLIRNSELNAVVINTKEPFGPRMDDDLKTLVAELHQEGVWVIARHVLFQDDDLAEKKPQFSLRRTNGARWQDRGGHGWVDPASREVWQYNLALAQKALLLGFDEINLDYIRFPTDGDIANIIYPAWDKKNPRQKCLGNF